MLGLALGLPFSRTASSSGSVAPEFDTEANITKDTDGTIILTD